jgi:hypothetical protein
LFIKRYFVDLRRETFIPVLLSQPPMQRAKEEDKTERVGGNGKFTNRFLKL